MVKLLKPKIRVARRWLKRAGIVFLFFCFLAVIFYLVFKSDFLTIKYVNCWVRDKTSLADEKRWCKEAERLLLGKRVVSFKSTTVVDELKRKFLPVGEVVFKKKYPQTVLVQVSERKPVVKVCQPLGLDFLVDKEGVVYSEVLPEFRDLRRIVLELDAEIEVGQKIDAEVLALILLEEPQVSLIKYIGQQGIEVKSDDQLTIFFSREKELESQIRSLQMVLQKYKIEGKQLKQVDLRFDQPVVRY